MIQRITTIEDVKTFAIQLCSEERLNFHPDTDFSDYIDLETKEPTYTPERATELNELMSMCFEVCELEGVDIYDLMSLGPIAPTINFDVIDDVITVSYQKKTIGKNIEIEGHLRPYCTGRCKDYRFEPCEFSNEQSERYFGSFYERIESEVVKSFKKI